MQYHYPPPDADTFTLQTHRGAIQLRVVGAKRCLNGLLRLACVELTPPTSTAFRFIELFTLDGYYVEDYIHFEDGVRQQCDVDLQQHRWRIFA